MAKQIVNMYNDIEKLLRKAGCEVEMDHISEVTIFPNRIDVVEQLTNEAGRKYLVSDKLSKQYSEVATAKHSFDIRTH